MDLGVYFKYFKYIAQPKSSHFKNLDLIGEN